MFFLKLLDFQKLFCFSPNSSPPRNKNNQMQHDGVLVGIGMCCWRRLSELRRRRRRRHPFSEDTRAPTAGPLQTCEKAQWKQINPLMDRYLLSVFFNCSCEPLCGRVRTRCQVHTQSYTMKQQCIIILSLCVSLLCRFVYVVADEYSERTQGTSSV